MIQKIFDARGDWSMLISRLIIGGIFIFSGYSKVSHMGPVLTQFGQMHIPVFLTYIVCYGELIAGAMLVLGLWVEYSSLFLMAVMAGAIYFTRVYGFQVFGLPVAMLGGLFAIFGCGSGAYTVMMLKKFIPMGANSENQSVN